MAYRSWFFGLAILALVSCGKPAESEKDRLSKENTDTFAKSIASMRVDTPVRRFKMASTDGIGFRSVPPQDSPSQDLPSKEAEKTDPGFPATVNVKILSADHDTEEELVFRGFFHEGAASVLTTWSNGFDYEVSLTTDNLMVDANITLAQKKDGAVVNSVNIEKKSKFDLKVREAEVTDLPRSKAQKLAKSLTFFEGAEDLRAGLITYKIEGGKTLYDLRLRINRPMGPDINELSISGSVGLNSVTSYHAGWMRDGDPLKEEFVRAGGKASWDEAALKLEIQSTSEATLLPFKKLVVEGAEQKDADADISAPTTDAEPSPAPTPAP